MRSIEDVDKKTLDKIHEFFTTYKNYKGSNVEVLGFENAEYAEKEFVETKELFSKYEDMDKKEFIAKMLIQHPEKYKK